MLKQRNQDSARFDEVNDGTRYRSLQGLTQARKALTTGLRGDGTTGRHSAKPINYTTRGLYDRYIMDLSSLSMHFDVDVRLKLTRKLKALLSEENWDDEDLLPSETAFLTLLRAMLFLNVKKVPSIGTNGKGSLSATWLDERNRLTLECGANDDVSYVLSHEVEDGGIERSAGHTRLGRLRKVLEAFDPVKWFGDGGKKTV
jgi:hypothetical protein